MKISARRPTAASPLFSVSFTKIQAGFCLGGLIGVMAISFGLGVAVAEREPWSNSNENPGEKTVRIQPVRGQIFNPQNVKLPISPELSNSKVTSPNEIDNPVTIRPNFYKNLLRERATKEMAPLPLAGNRRSTRLEQALIQSKSQPEEKSDKSSPNRNSPAPTNSASSKLSGPASAKYTVQVTSVRNPAKAIRIIRKLRDSGYSGFINRIELPGKGAWLRIRVGRFFDLNAANQALKTLNSQISIQGARVVRF